jgi:hypothetical protein
MVRFSRTASAMATTAQTTFIATVTFERLLENGTLC